MLSCRFTGDRRASADIAEASAEGETYEPFDALVAEAAEEAHVVTESYESFEEFLADDALAPNATYQELRAATDALDAGVPR